MHSKNNFFGSFGGMYIAEVLRDPLLKLQQAFHEALEDREFTRELQRQASEYIGRPTPLLHAEQASKALGGAQVYVKLEGLAHTGAHKINNAMGQAVLAKRMGKTRIIAETGAGQHGVAVAAVCARLGLACVVYMGRVDMRRQYPNVFWMKQYGATVVPVDSGSQTLKDAVNEALRDWAGSYDSTHYLLGSALGPAPYPDMVRQFQSVIGEETALQSKDLQIEALIACVGGGSNAIGFFSPYITQDTPRLIGVEAGGTGKEIGEHATRMNGKGTVGVVQGYKSIFLLDEEGQVCKTHSISAGLDYPGIGPQLADLGSRGRVEFETVTDQEALDALQFFARNEGLSFALESAHAGAYAMKLAPQLPSNAALIVHMSGRGDKDIFITAGALGGETWKDFLKEEAEA
ncbi:MAG: tryptophan synthase subunit beta [Spirochaetota bacterium]